MGGQRFSFNGRMNMLRAAFFSLLSVVATQMAMAGNAITPLPDESFFPLAVGNTWTYECSSEGEFQFNAKTSIVSVATQNGRTVYRSEMRIDNNPELLVTYLHIDLEGQVMYALASDLVDAKPIMAVTPKVGDQFDDLIVAAIEPSSLRKFSGVTTARLENYPYPMDGPEDRQLLWRSKIYGKGIGLLEEADGLGGACVLTSFRLRKAK